MIKKILRSIFITIILFFIAISTTTIHAEKNNGKKIVIDAGHGGNDGGAQNTNTNISEDEINLAIALKLEKILKKDGYQVLMTRDSSYDMFGDQQNISTRKKKDLQKRVSMRNQFNPDIFISIHGNEFQDKSQKGAQVWYADNQSSALFAERLKNNLIQYLDKNNHRQCKNAKKDYRVLTLCGENTAVLIECGFISNDEESKMLSNNDYQYKIAKIIKKTIDDTFK